MMWEDDREVPENRYVYTPMPKFSAENAFIYAFVVVVIVLCGLAIYGKLTGRWEVQPW